MNRYHIKPNEKAAKVRLSERGSRVALSWRKIKDWMVADLL
jgi:hypothetical protein